MTIFINIIKFNKIVYDYKGAIQTINLERFFVYKLFLVGRFNFGILSEYNERLNKKLYKSVLVNDEP